MGVHQQVLVTCLVCLIFSEDEFEMPSKIFQKVPLDEDGEWVPQPNELPLYVLMGRINHIPPPMNKVVKIFLSSTFTGGCDFHGQYTLSFIHLLHVHRIFGWWIKCPPHLDPNKCDTSLQHCNTDKW